MRARASVLMALATAACTTNAAPPSALPIAAPRFEASVSSPARAEGSDRSRGVSAFPGATVQAANHELTPPLAAFRPSPGSVGATLQAEHGITASAPSELVKKLAACRPAARSAPGWVSLRFTVLVPGPQGPRPVVAGATARGSVDASVEACVRQLVTDAAVATDFAELLSDDDARGPRDAVLYVTFY